MGLPALKPQDALTVMAVLLAALQFTAAVFVFVRSEVVFHQMNALRNEIGRLDAVAESDRKNAAAHFTFAGQVERWGESVELRLRGVSATLLSTVPEHIVLPVGVTDRDFQLAFYCMQLFSDNRDHFFKALLNLSSFAGLAEWRLATVIVTLRRQSGLDDLKLNADDTALVDGFLLNWEDRLLKPPA